MAKMLQVRNVPDDLHEALRQRANSRALSLSAYVLQELEGIAERPAMGEVLARARQRGGHLSFSEAIDTLHHQRAERP